MSVGAWLRRNVARPLWVLKTGSRFYRYLAEAERAQYLRPDELDALRWGRMRRLLEWAEREVPYYAEAFRRAGVSAADVRSWNDLAALPLLRKRDIQERLDALTARRLPDGDTPVENMTGGSTGVPLRFFTSRRRNEYKEASTVRHDRWSGWEIGEPFALLWGAQSDLADWSRPSVGRIRQFLVQENLTLNTTKVRREDLEAFVRLLAKKRPKTWQAYANSAVLLARYIEERGVQGVRPDAVITSAEVLTDENRAFLERTLGCTVYDRYGCREVSIVASECGRAPGHAMHLNADALHVEVVGAGGGPGKVVVTDLLNFATPFIRYQIEDVSELVEGPCPCGRTLPLLAPLSGRTTDFIVTADDGAVSGIAVCTYLLTSLPGVERGQFVQERKGEVVFRFVPAAAYEPASDREIVAACERFFGAATRVEIERVDEIPHGPSGKHPFTISSVDPFEVLV